jgi:hypothetical protein
VRDVHPEGALRDHLFAWKGLAVRQQPIRYPSLAKIAFIGTDPQRRRVFLTPYRPASSQNAPLTPATGLATNGGLSLRARM